MKYATLQAGVDFFHGIRIASELRPNCVRIVQNNVRTDKRKEETEGRLKGTEERTKRTEETKQR